MLMWCHVYRVMNLIHFSVWLYQNKTRKKLRVLNTNALQNKSNSHSTSDLQKTNKAIVSLKLLPG